MFSLSTQYKYSCFVMVSEQRTLGSKHQHSTPDFKKMWPDCLGWSCGELKAEFVQRKIFPNFLTSHGTLVNWSSTNEVVTTISTYRLNKVSTHQRCSQETDYNFGWTVPWWLCTNLVLWKSWKMKAILKGITTRSSICSHLRDCQHVEEAWSDES